MQSVLSFLLNDAHTTSDLALLGIIFNLVKYTAPAFIFAIVYGMVKGNQHTRVGHFYKEKFMELVVPYILWATASLIVFPNIQLNGHVNSFWSLIECYFFRKCLTTVLVHSHDVAIPVTHASDYFCMLQVFSKIFTGHSGISGKLHCVCRMVMAIRYVCIPWSLF